MTSVSQEEENYARMGLLLTGISLRAARVLFDNEFHPFSLKAALKEEYNKLQELKKKRVINEHHWNLLFPKSPCVPKSETFDLTLIILLLRNLTDLKSPHGGFDCLPIAIETTPASDLARIKYYRNYMAHRHDAKLDNLFFNTAWEVVSEAVGRLGGHSMRNECDQLKYKTLERKTNEVINELKQSLESHKVKMKRTVKRMKTSYRIVLHEKAKSETKLQTVQRQKEQMAAEQDEVIPRHIREQIKEQIKDWQKKDNMFVATRASEYVIECVQNYSCVTLTAPAGVGKSFIARHTALLLQQDGYKIIPVYAPTDIRNYYQPGKQTLFIVDDICGNFIANQQQIDNWKQLLPVINTIIADTCCKIIVSCRLQVYKDDKFNILPPFKYCECNLISKELRLKTVEKIQIANMYMGTNCKGLKKVAKRCEFFPLLCYLYHEKGEFDATEFFRNPFDVYKNELDNLCRHGDEGNYKVCSLALCVILNNQNIAKWFQGKVTNKQRKIIEDTCEACKLNKNTPKAVLKEALDTLDGTFIHKQNGIYRTLHDKLFDFLAHYFGQKMIECLIDHGDSHLVRERFVWHKSPDENGYVDFIIEIPDDYIESYLERLIKDWSLGKVTCVLITLI